MKPAIVDINRRGQITVDGQVLKAVEPMLENWQCNPLQPTEAFKRGIQAYAKRFKLKEVSICGRDFLPNGEPKVEVLFTVEDLQGVDRFWKE